MFAILLLAGFSIALVLAAVSMSELFKPSKEEGIYCNDARALSGDTLEIDPSCFRNATQLRLIGVDAPKITECGGIAARDELSKLVDGREIHLVLDSSVKPIDNRGRAAVRVLVGDGRDVGLNMITAGRAKVGEYSGQLTGRIRIYRQGEQLARERNLGIWRECSN